MRTAGNMDLRTEIPHGHYRRNHNRRQQQQKKNPKPSFKKVRKVDEEINPKLLFFTHHRK